MRLLWLLPHLSSPTQIQILLPGPHASPCSLSECLAAIPGQEALLLARPMCSDLDRHLGKVRAHLFHHVSVGILPGA